MVGEFTNPNQNGINHNGFDSHSHMRKQQRGLLEPRTTSAAAPSAPRWQLAARRRRMPRARVARVARGFSGGGPFRLSVLPPPPSPSISGGLKQPAAPIQGRNGEDPFRFGFPQKQAQSPFGFNTGLQIEAKRDTNTEPKLVDLSFWFPLARRSRLWRDEVGLLGRLT